MQGTEPAPGLEEFDLGYYGWHVVLAASLGVMAGFGSLFVCTFAVFVKPLGAEFGWNREAISRGFGIAAVTLDLSVAPVSASNVPAINTNVRAICCGEIDWPAISDLLQWSPRITARNGDGDVVNISTIRFYFV